MDTQKEIIKKIKILMIEKEIENYQIAEILGINKDAWFKRVNLVVKLQIEEVKKIADYFNVSINDLV